MTGVQMVKSLLKSLFNKSACGSDAKQLVIEQDSDSDKHFLTKYLKVNTKPGLEEKSKYPTLGNVLKGMDDEGNEDSCSNRKSFLEAIKRKCSPSSTSSSSSSGSSSSPSSFSYSNGVYKLCKRNSSADSELEDISGQNNCYLDKCVYGGIHRLTTYSQHSPLDDIISDQSSTMEYCPIKNLAKENPVGKNSSEGKKSAVYS
ncbi:hypothetical protein LXL04_034586 [Taraxacum kok-saghyz]